jgi:hypothetical protein
MPFELSLMWGIHAFLALFTLGALFAVSRPRYRRALVYRFSHTIELPLVTDEIAAAAERRILHRTAAMMAGGLVGILASAVVVYIDPASASAPTIWLVTLPLTLSGMCAGAAFVTLRESLFRRHPDAVRIARAVTVTLRDYISPRRLRVPPAILLAAAGLCLAGSVLGLAGLIDGSTFILSAALPMLATALVVTIAGAVLARRVLDQPQPAGSELELAWDDAFRADTLRALWMFGSVIAWLAVAAAGLGMLQGLDAVAGTTWSLGLGSQLFTWGFLVILISFSFGGAQNHFRFALWSDLPLASAEAAPARSSAP